MIQIGWRTLARTSARKQRRRCRGVWNRFWFQRQDPSLVGLIRVCTGVMLVYSHFVWGLQLFDFFGDHAWVSPELVRELQRDQFQFSYLLWFGDEWLVWAHRLAFLPLIAFALGYQTRLTSILAVIIHMSYGRGQPTATFGLDQILAFLTLYLAYGFLFTPSSQRAFSIDRWLWARSQRKGDASNAPTLPPSYGAHLTLRLIQIQMCLVYFFAGISKLQGDSWWNGEAMWLAFSNEEYANSLSMLWTSRFPAILALLGHATVFWEVSFAALVWNKSLRPIVLTFGLLMHLGIGLFLSMWTFGLMMIVGCASFVSTDWLASLLYSEDDASIDSVAPHQHETVECASERQDRLASEKSIAARLVSVGAGSRSGIQPSQDLGFKKPR